jgi:hypothetical protein
MAISGTHGAVVVDGEALPDVRQWTLTRRSESRAYASSSTAGCTRRLPGLRDWSVTFELYRDDGDVPFDVGDVVTLRLWVTQAGDHRYEGQAVIDSIRPVVDIEAGRIVSVTVTASADGALSGS